MDAEYIAQGITLAAFAGAMVGICCEKGNAPEFDMSECELKRRQGMVKVKRLRYRNDFAGRLVSLNPSLVRRVQ